MNKLPVVFTSILLLVGSILGAVALAVPAHAAATGVVCIIPSGASSCPSTPASITGTVGSQLRVSVFLQNSSGINGFDITLLADRTILRPAGVDLTGTVLIGTPTILVECLQGILVQGSVCPLTDTINTIEVAATSALGTGLTNAPTTALLFTAIYNVTSATVGTPLEFQTGCSNTSTSSNACVTIANGTPTPVAESVQTAIFSTSTAPNFLISANPSSLTIVEDSSATSTITLTSINGLNGTVSLSTISPPLCSQPGCSGWTLNPTSMSLSAGGTSTATLSIFAGTVYPGPGNSLSLPINATINGLSHSTNVVFTTVAPPAPDFTIQASPTTLSVVQGFTGSALLTLGSVQGFNGTVTLAASSSSTGLIVSLTQTSVVLSSGGTGTSELSVATLSTTPVGTYSVTVSGSAGSISHSLTITVTVTSSTSSEDFTITDSATFISIPVASERQTVVTVSSINGFSGNVILVAKPSFPAFACWFTTLTNTSTVFVPSGSSANQFPTCGAGRPAGAYTLTITGTSGSLSHAVSLAVNITDFSIAGPSSISFNAGSSDVEGLTFSSLAGFAGTISLTAASPAALSVSCPSSVTLVSSGTSTVICSLASSTPGTYNATFTGTFVCSDCYYNGKDINTLSTNVTVSGTAQPDFTISASPSSVTLGCVGSATSTVTLSSLNGFSGTIGLTVNVAPLGVSAVINPTTFTLSAGGSGTSTLAVSLNAAAGGTYQVTITGSSGVLTHSTTVSVIVTLSPCFGITASPTSITLNPGQTGTSTITVASINGFTGNIVLSATSPAGLTASLNPTNVVLGGTATSVLTISSTSSTPPGTYTITVTGSSGAITQSVTVAVTVNSVSQPDFSLSANPSSITIAPGTSGTSTITVTALNGFTGVVSLTDTASSGITATISPTSVTGSGTATLTVTGSSSGTFSVQVTGVSGSLVHSITVPVAVTSVGLFCIVQSSATSCPVSPASLTGAVGTQLRVAVFIQSSGGLNGFDVTLLADHTILRPAGIDLTGTVLVGTPSIVVECLSGVLVTGSICSSIDTIDTIELAATSAPGSGITSTPTTGLLFTAIYNVTGTSSGTSLGFQTGCANTSVSGGVCVTVANGSILPVPETVKTATFSNGVSQPDFSITASPTTIESTAGALGSSTITIAPIYGFTGTVILTFSVSPAGLTCTLSPTSIMLGSGQTSTVLCSGSAGVYTVAVTGTSGSQSHSATITFIVADFTLTASPTALSIPAGGTATSTITVSAVNGLTGTITFAVSSSPRLTATISPSSLFVSGGSATATLTISSTTSTPSGSYTVMVTGTSGAVTHSTTVSVTVSGTPDFTITATPTTQTISKGGSATFTITIKGANSFNGTVTLSTTISPLVKNGPKISLPTTVGPYSNSTLTVSTTRSTPIGTYTITVTATSGSITHKVTITVIVTK